MLKKDLQVEDLYKDVEAIPKDILFLAGMCNLVWIKGAEYLEPTKEEKCFKENPLPPDFKESPTQYANNSFESTKGNNNEEYLKIHQTVKDKVGSTLSDGKGLLRAL